MCVCVCVTLTPYDSDNIWALREYATQLKKPFIYGPTSHAERTRVLHAFKNDPNVNTVFLSKVSEYIEASDEAAEYGLVLDERARARSSPPFAGRR